MSVIGKQMDGLNMVSTYFEVQDLICTESVFLNQILTYDFNKKLVVIKIVRITRNTIVSFDISSRVTKVS